jgi:hypothetical protein
MAAEGSNLAYDDPTAVPESPLAADDRRIGPGRRVEDRQRRFRDMAATLLAFCGGLAILYLFFAAIGTVKLKDAAVATAIAIVLAIVWLFGAYQRWKSGAMFITRRDRERRGF